ncbi:MAG: TonB-dependent receptor [Novosphingobium sp.]|nr:TonB-dependent receptor [Novosphingobium sp.]MCP5403728.1 TonB-dependent receptor [Novosphingobium sp.]
MIGWKLRSCLLFGVAAGAVMAPQPVAAQSEGSSGSAESSVPGDIIVTARRRQESILKVPVVETVLTSEQLENNQIKDLTDLATRVPGLNMGIGPLTIGPQISLRGIGTNALDQGIDQSVSLNVDGLSMTQGLAYSAGMFDLAQAEVLKGPQALFFGKNSPGGVVSLRTNDPGDELEIIARLGYEAEAEEKRGELIISTPVTDTFGLRLAGMSSFQEGFFRNRAQNLGPDAFGSIPLKRKFAETRSHIVRLTGLWEPTTDFTARLKLNWAYDNIQGDAGQGQRADCPNGNRPDPASGVIFQNPDDDCRLNRSIYLVGADPAFFPNVRNGGVPRMVRDQKFGTLELSYDTGNINLTSITGYYDLRSESLINAILTGYSAAYYFADNHFYRHDFTQEFRADSDYSGPLNFTVGAFYQDGVVFNRLQLPVNRALLPEPSFPTGFLATGSHKLSIESYSAFGQVRYQVVPTVELAAGVRWSHETRSDRVLFNVFEGSTPLDISLPNNDKFTSKNWSPEATITWTPTDDLTLFAAVKQGYKSGSFTLVTPAANPHFGDERIRGGEIGLKSRLLDRQLSVNLAGYYYKYKGLQVNLSLTDPVTGFPVIVTQNAGGAKIYGIDFDFSYSPDAIDGLTISGAINWNHSRFTDFANATCINGQTISEGCNLLPDEDGLFTAQDLTGQPLPRGADWTGNAAISYEMPAGEDAIIRFGVAGQYSSKFIRTLGLDPAYYQPTYATVDGNIAYGAADDSWEVALIGRNLSNKITAGSCTASSFEQGGFTSQVTGAASAGPAGKSEFSCIARRGREVWLRLTVKG